MHAVDVSVIMNSVHRALIYNFGVTLFKHFVLFRIVWVEWWVSSLLSTCWLCSSSILFILKGRTFMLVLYKDFILCMFWQTLEELFNPILWIKLSQLIWWFLRAVLFELLIYFIIIVRIFHIFNRAFSLLIRCVLWKDFLVYLFWLIELLLSVLCIQIEDRVVI